MLNCKYCNKECKNSNSLKNHECRCKLNLNREYTNGMLGKKGNNQYSKAKELGLPIPKMSLESRKRISESSKKRKHSEETKKKLSEIRKKFLEENPDKVPYLLNHTSKISYPEQYFLNCFSNIQENFEFQHHVFRYKLDFANPAEKIYFEVDGEQHYVDKRIVEHDIKRTKKLEELGWKGIRIRWSHFQKLSDLEKEENVLRIQKEMKWLE